MNRILVLFLGASLVLTAGCAKFTRSSGPETLQVASASSEKIAILPVLVSEDLTVSEGEEVSHLVEREFAEALSARGFGVIPADDVRKLLERERMNVRSSQVGRLLYQQFGVDKVLVGSVPFFQKREGERMGATRGARVRMVVDLYRTSDGERVRHSVFDERQKALSQNVFRNSRYPGGGTRWLTAEEIARWGVEEIVDSLISR